MGFLSNLFGSGGYSRGGRVSTSSKTKIEVDWQKVKQLLDQGSPSQLRQALITADKTLDFALKDLVTGETMGERLKNAKDLFDKPFYDRIWKAHKLRNSLVHEVGFEPPYHMIERAVDTLRQALRKLNVMV